MVHKTNNISIYLIYLRRCGTSANHTVNSPFNSNKIYKFYIEGKGQAHMKFLVPIDSSSYDNTSTCHIFRSKVN